MAMRRAAFWTGVFLAGGVLGLVNDLTLGKLWMSLEWQEPVADWLLSKAVPPRAVAYWGMIWIKMPDWITLILLGAVIGRLTGSPRWYGYALVSGLGFIAYSLMYAVWYGLALAKANAVLAIGTCWRSAAWNLASLVLLLSAAWLFSRNPGKPVSESAVDER